MTPPPLGRIIVLLCYWAMIVYFMSWNAVKDDVYFYERIAFRNAWVTVMQLPLLYLLAMKVNVVGFLLGSSHERLNWLHRWIARTMFVTATMHGFHFWTEWVQADFVEYEMSIMPMVKYGLGAWAVLLWNVVVGFLPLRRLAYEVWLLQHIASSIVMVVLLYIHVPEKARYLIIMSISFLGFDRAARWALTIWQNTNFKTEPESPCRGKRRLGHTVLPRAVGDSITVLTIKDVHFQWHAGQHVYLWIPRLGLLETHPYTIACAHQTKGSGICCCNSIQLIVRAHKGFSRRIHSHAQTKPGASLRGFLVGPFGVPTKWDTFETLVLIGASTGGSFTMPILEHVAYAKDTTCVRRISVVLVAKTAEEVEYYVERATAASNVARNRGVEVDLHVAITGGAPVGRSSIDSRANEKMLSAEDTEAEAVDSPVREYTQRPDIDALIREPVEQAWGETAVVVCGGKEIVARTRNCVSQLSDERAVHRGTGAQGIYLHVEEYSF